MTGNERGPGEGAASERRGDDGSIVPPECSCGPQRSLLDFLDHKPEDTASERQEAGMRRAELGTRPGTKAALERVLDELIRSGRTFTAETIRARCEPLGGSPNVLGSIINNAAREGRVECVGYTTASRPAAHRRLLRQWRGVQR